MKFLRKYTFGLILAFLAFFGFADMASAAVDVSAATTAITTDGTDAIQDIGTAKLGLAGLAVVLMWAKAAIFG